MNGNSARWQVMIAYRNWHAAVNKRVKVHGLQLVPTFGECQTSERRCAIWLSLIPILSQATCACALILNIDAHARDLGYTRREGVPNYKLRGPVSQMSRKRFGSEKPFVNLRPAYSVKLVFSYVAKEIKIKITTKFRASRRPCFEDTKRIMSAETFEKRAPRHQQTFPEVSTIRTPRLNVEDVGIESSVSFSDYQPKLF